MVKLFTPLSKILEFVFLVFFMDRGIIYAEKREKGVDILKKKMYNTSSCFEGGAVIRHSRQIV